MVRGQKGYVKRNGFVQNGFILLLELVGFTTIKVNFLLFLIEVMVGARLTTCYYRSSDASYCAGLMALLQTSFQVFLGAGITAILFYGVLSFTLWMGYFHVHQWLAEKPTFWVNTWACFGITALTII
ncbi:MAG: hypothetical protein AAGJ81_05405 [Verrucomicrobiota bacterium]